MDLALHAPGHVRLQYRVVLHHIVYLAVRRLCVTYLLAHLFEEQVDLNRVDLPRPALYILAKRRLTLKQAALSQHFHQQRRLEVGGIERVPKGAVAVKDLFELVLIWLKHGTGLVLLLHLFFFGNGLHPVRHLLEFDELFSVEDPRDEMLLVH